MEKSLQLKPRDIHIDLIRTIALIAIVSVHAAGRHFITSQELNQFSSLGVASWIVVLIYQCFAVLGVPLFLMLSGMLLL
jgi:surface polysaccharide O-acyltransferase-like enzyme